MTARAIGTGPTRRALVTGLAASAALGCELGGREGRARQPGDLSLQRTIRFGGEDRAYQVLVPGERAGPIPLVVALHGGGGDEESMLAPEKGLPRAARERGWAMAFPSGNRGSRGQWSPDDDELILRIADEIGTHVALDAGRLWLVGFSGGARLAYQTAAEHSDRIAGIAAVCGRAGVYGPDGRTWVAPYDPNLEGGRDVPVFALAGGKDPIRLGCDRTAFAACSARPGATEAACAAETRDGLSFDESLALWVRANQATEEAPAPMPGAPPRVSAWRRVNPVTGVCVQGAIDPELGHAWPAWDLADTIFEFFEGTLRRIPA